MAELILPEKINIELDRSKTRQELVLKDGVIQDIHFAVTLNGMSDGDIELKGADIINYHNG